MRNLWHGIGGFWAMAVVASLGLLAPTQTQGAVVSFLVDPDTIDVNMDGFITGNELMPVGSDGVVFTTEPTDNLVGTDRFSLSLARGIHFGGGGGSTLSFDFSVDHPVTLNSYTLASSGFILGDPDFDIREGANVLSASNTAVSNGDTHNFNSGPISLDAGTTYSFVVNTTGAGIQSFMASWDYTLVPEPATGWIGLVMLAGLSGRRSIASRRQQR